MGILERPCKVCSPGPVSCVNHLLKRLQDVLKQPFPEFHHECMSRRQRLVAFSRRGTECRGRRPDCGAHRRVRHLPGAAGATDSRHSRAGGESRSRRWKPTRRRRRTSPVRRTSLAEVGEEKPHGDSGRSEPTIFGGETRPGINEATDPDRTCDFSLSPMRITMGTPTMTASTERPRRTALTGSPRTI